MGDRDAVVDPAHRDHAHRAAGAVDELDVGGQQVVDPVLVDRVGVPAADLHHLVVAAGLDGARGSRPPARGRARRRGTRRRTSCRGLRRLRRAIAVPAWTSSRSPGATGADEQDVDLGRWRRLVARTGRGRAPSSTLDHAHSTASSPQVMQPSKSAMQAVQRARSLDHARLQLLELLLVVRAHAARAARASRAPPPRRPSRARSRRGSAPSRRAATPPSSSSSRPMLTLRRTPATSTLASRLASSTNSMTCPGIARHMTSVRSRAARRSKPRAVSAGSTIDPG